MPLDESATTTLVKVSDDFFRWVLARFMNLFPDVQEGFDLQPYVASGFDDAGLRRAREVDNLLMLIGYLLPLGDPGVLPDTVREDRGPDLSFILPLPALGERAGVRGRATARNVCGRQNHDKRANAMKT